MNLFTRRWALAAAALLACGDNDASVDSSLPSDSSTDASPRDSALAPDQNADSPDASADAGSAHSLGLPPLRDAVMDAYLAGMLADSRESPGFSPHLRGHWMEHAYAGPAASLDTSWRAGHDYVRFELTHDGGSRAFRATTAGRSGDVQPDWSSLAEVGETLVDGEVTWLYVGKPGTFLGEGPFDLETLGEGRAYYDVLGTTLRVLAFLESNGHDEHVARFERYARYARGTVRDSYDRPAGFQVPARRVFGGGYYRDRTRWPDDPDRSTLDDLATLRDRGAFGTPLQFGLSAMGADLARPVAYTGLAEVYAERAGLPRIRLQPGDTRDEIGPVDYELELLVRFAESHMWEWRSGTYLEREGDSTKRFAPFMFGLSAGFLAAFYEWEEANGRDPNAFFPREHWDSIPLAIADVAEHLFDAAVTDPGSPSGAGQRLMVELEDGLVAFRQSSGDESEDVNTLLNMLFVPAYGFAGRHLAEDDPERARALFARGDRVFEGGAIPMVTNVTWAGKAWFQQFYHSTEYLRWRGEVE